ncbi:MAG: recombinase family protein [Clostridiales bacterium]|nr:recombinase family protein [Clostridiales bacterium]
MSLEKAEKCYIYTRVSTDLQLDGYSLEAQFEECKNFAGYKNMKVVKTYTDEGKSGKDVDGRADFLQMMKDIETNKDGVSAVLVFKLSRFGRNATDVLKYVEFLKEYNVTLFAVKDGVDSSSTMGKFMITMLSAVAEMERVNILEQTQAGRNQKAKLGKWNGGKPPIGYTLVPKEGTLLVNEDEAKIVRAIFYKYVNERKSVHTIAVEINAEYKKPQRQKHDNPFFAEHNIRRILDDITYSGVIAYGRTYTVPNNKSKSGKLIRHKQTDESKIIYVPGSFEAIIDNDTWELAKKQRNIEKGKKAHKKKSPSNHIYPLTGLILCPECGRFLDGRKNWGKTSKKTGVKGPDTYDYGCKNHINVLRGHEKCPFSRQFNEDKMCAQILKVIDAIAENDEFAKAIAEKINAAVDVSELEGIKSNYEKDLRRAQISLTRISNECDLLNPEDPTYEVAYDNCRERMNKMYQRITELKQLISDSISKINAAYESKLTLSNINEILKNFGKLYSSFSEEEKRSCLHLLIESIEVQNYDKKPLDYSNVIKSIKFRFPLNTNGDETSGLYLTDEKNAETVVLLSRK